MAETFQFQLPLLSPSQAQKHVTVNEALGRLDALARLRVAGVLAFAPASPGNGTCYLVAPGATGVWLGHDAEVAIRSNGGWTFAIPDRGWSAWDVVTDRSLVFDGQAWVAEAASTSQSGAATIGRIIEFDHSIGAGATSVTAVVIPSHAKVIAVTGRVTGAVSGSGLTSFSIGVAADSGRYGSGIGLPLNSYSKGITGSSVTYFSDTALVLTANAGTFSAGAVRLAIHVIEVVPPRAI